VRDASRQLAERIELLRFMQLLLNFRQLVLCFLAFRDIAGDLGKANQLAVFIPDRINDNAGSEKGAILAYAPAFFFIAAHIEFDLVECFYKSPKVLKLLLQAALSRSRSTTLDWVNACRSSVQTPAIDMHPTPLRRPNRTGES